MLILGLDCAGSSCGVALWRDGVMLGLSIKPMERGQDQCLLPMIETLLRDQKITYEALDRIAVTRGPGSFTGLRIGLATARGISLAAHKPILGVDRLELYQSYFKDRSENLLVVLGAKRRECFVRLYPDTATPAVPTMMTLPEIEEYLKRNPHTLLCGDDEASKLQNYQPMGHEELEVMCSLASRIDLGDKAYDPSPLYIRPPDVTLKKAQRIVRTIKIEDAHTIALIHQKCFGSAGWTLEQLESSLRLPTTQGLALVVGNETSAFILIQQTRPTAEIITFAVLPTFQRQGIGFCLLARLLETLHKNGFEFLDLDVAADNEAAKNLYEKIGFKRIGTRRDYYQRGQDKVDALQYRIDFKNDTFATFAAAC